MSADTAREGRPFAYYAGRFSCFVFAIVYGTARVLGGPNTIPDWVALSLIGLGLVLATVAMCATDPERNIRGPAIAGILLNAFLMYAYAADFVKARAQERPHTEVQRNSGGHR
jgi:hypothetical protein